MMTRPSAIVILLSLSFTFCLAHERQRLPVCSAATFASFRPLPNLSYECPKELIESDDKILGLPARLAALTEVTHELESFTNAAWWRADVGELRACEIHGQ